jgi:hypothetical protein
MRSHVFCMFLLAMSPAAGAQALSGLWDATVDVDGLMIPLRMELKSSGS